MLAPQMIRPLRVSKAAPTGKFEWRLYANSFAMALFEPRDTVAPKTRPTLDRCVRQFLLDGIRQLHRDPRFRLQAKKGRCGGVRVVRASLTKRLAYQYPEQSRAR